MSESTNEPVAVIGSGFQLLWCRQDWSQGLKVGDCLYTHPQDQKKDEALRLALEALRFSTSPAPSVAELQNDAITLIEQALENK